MRDVHMGELIDTFSKSQHWTRSELSQILDISLSNMHKKLKEKDLNTSFLKRVANAAGVDLPDLFSVTVNQTGNHNTVGESTHYYGRQENNTLVVYRERIKGLEAENEALKNHINTLTRLLSTYENKK